MNITIKDVARELGVSYSSISRALNGKEGVSEATRKTIVAAAKRMGYQPNELARGLVNKISKTVGVIIPDINNPFFGEIVTGITMAAKANDYDIFLCISDWDSKNEKEYLSTLSKKRVDGIILKPAGNNIFENYEEIRIPLMIIENHEENKRHSSVEVDNEYGGYLAAKHLLGCGYKKLGFILGSEDRFACQQRLKGAEKALIEYNHELDTNAVIEGSFTIEGGRSSARLLLEKVPKIDAIFCMNDLIALGVLQHLSEVHIAVPDKLGVIGFDNISYAGLPQIELTTIHQPKNELGKLLFENILEEIQQKGEKEPVRIVIQPELKIRKTTKNRINK